MNDQSQTQTAGPALTVLLAVDLTLCLAVASILDLAVSIGHATLIWVLAGLLVVLLALLVGLIWQARKTGLSFPTAESSPIPLQVVLPVLVFVILLATGLRLYRLGAQSLWFDEVWTIRASDRPLLGIVRNINSLTYVVTHLLLQLDLSAFVLRFGSAFAGVLTVPAVYHLGRMLYGRKEGLMTAFFFSVSYYAIWHSQEVRFYSWQMLFSTLSLYFMLRGLRTNQARDWAGFALCTALNLYTHPLTLVLLASQGLYVAFALTRDLTQQPALDAAPWKARLGAWTRQAAWPSGAAVVALAAYLAQLPALLRYFNPHWFTGIESGLAQPLYYTATTWLTDPVVYGVYGLFGLFAGVQEYPVFLYILLGLLLVGLITSRPKIIVLTLIIILLPLFVVMVGQIRIYERYFSYYVPLFLALMAHGIAYLTAGLGRKKWQRIVISTVLISLVVVPNLARLSLYHSRPEKDQWREAAAIVDAGFLPGDLILINSFYSLTILPLDWYATTPEEKLPRKFFPEGGVLSDMGQLDYLEGYVQGYDRVWLLFANQTPELEAPLLGSMMDTHRQVGDWPLFGVHLILFETHAATEDQ